MRTKGYEVHETPYEESKVKEKKPRGGYCSSLKCVQERNSKVKYNNFNRLMVLKTKDRAMDRCQDCGNFLYWGEISVHIRQHEGFK